MKKKITRYRKTIIAEVVTSYDYKGEIFQIVVDSKEFNNWKGSLFGIEPTKKTYIKAHLWADNVIFLQENLGS